jgi:hypothetical protein
MPFRNSIRHSSRAWFAFLLASVISSAANTSHAQVCPFDDGNSSLPVEGLILTRYALGITGAPVVASTGINAVDAPTVEAAINCPSCGLNITGNATLTVADATIISRKLAGFSGAQLTNGIALGSGTRNTPAAVQSFLLAGCGATGGTVTGITAGSGLTGGTITGSGTIAVNSAVIQNRVSGTCAVGSSIRAIAADGSVTCQTDTTGGSGTVTNVATGLGLTGGPVTSTGTISADTNYLQRRVSASCAVGSSIRAIAADGTVTCQVDSGGTGGGGTVTSVASGTGLSGGPITAAGTLSIANPFRLPQSCVNGQIAKYNTSTQLWECATDNGGNGTVANVAAGTGLAGGPVTTSGTLAIAPAFALPQSCANGQYTRYNGASSVWECVTPAVVTNVATGPGLTGGPITSTGTVGLASTQLLPTIACSNNQIPKWSGSAWLCASATTGGSAGTVTNIATGTGLTGGPITGAGTIGLTPGQLLPTVACATDQTVQWSGTAWVCAPSLQTQLTSCPIVGQVPQVGLGGSIVCGSLPHTFTKINGSSRSSVAVTADGLPVISYYDGAMKVIKCGSVSCSGGNTDSTVDSTFVGSFSSIAVPADGLPVIGYSAGGGGLKVAKCGNAACSSGNTVTTVDSLGGFYPTLAISVDGFPVISHYDAAAYQIRVVKCGDATCSAANLVLTTVAFSAFDVESTSMAVPADGLPVISYFDRNTTALKVFKCGTASCNNFNTLTTVATVDYDGVDSAIAVSANGLPIVSYVDYGIGVLSFLKCGNATCSSGNTLLTIDGSGAGRPSIVVPADGLPVISYLGFGYTLKVAKCGNANCDASNTLSIIGNVGNSAALQTSIVVPVDGRPVIAYYDSVSGDAKVVKCSNTSCLNPY